MAAPQRFPLPNMPFRREIHSGCAIGTSITLKAQAFKAREKSFTLQLSTAKDIAVLVTIPIAKSGKMAVSARIGGKFTSEVDKPILLPVEVKFTLHLRIAQFATEVYFNDNHMLDFVHRVSPSEIKEVHIEGPLIVEEVVFSPPQGASLDPVPSYEQATSMGSDPIKEFRHLNIGPPTSNLNPTPVPASGLETSSVLMPTPAPPAIGLSSAIVNQPMAGVPIPSASTSTNPFLTSSSEKFPALLPSGPLNTKPSIYENTSNLVPTAFEQARYTPVSTTSSPYVTSPTPTPAPTPSPAAYPGSSTMPALQPTPFQQTAFPPLQPTPYPSSSQALQPQPAPGPVAGMPYPQLMPQPSATGHPYAPGVNPYQQYPAGVPGQQGYAMHPHYNPYQQPSPYPYPMQSVAYAPGYPPQQYASYPAFYGSGCHGKSTEQRSSEEVAAGDRPQNSEPSVDSSASERSSTSNPDPARINSFIEGISSDQATIHLLFWLEMMDLFVRSLSNNPQAVQQLLEQNNAVANNPEKVQHIRAQVPWLVDMVRRPEFTSALKNPKVLTAVRSIEREMETIRREAPALVEVLRGAQNNAVEEQTIATQVSTSSTSTNNEQPRPRSGVDDSVDPDLLCQLYQEDLDKLTRMGFSDRTKSLAALRASNGNMAAAVEFLLNHSKS